MHLTATMVKSAALEAGADLVGIAAAGRWRNAPPELSPRGIMPDAQSVIVIAVSLTDAGNASKPAAKPAPPPWSRTLTANASLI